MARRKTRNRTGLQRTAGIPVHHAGVGFVCLGCCELNLLDVSTQLLDPETAFETARWPCKRCGYAHSKDSDLPFGNWPPEFRDRSDLAKRLKELKTLLVNYQLVEKLSPANRRILGFD